MQPATIRWLSRRTRLGVLAAFVVGSFLPPYAPAAEVGLEDVSVRTPQVLLVEDGFIMKSSSLTQQGSRRAYAEGIIHTVRDGDSLDKLAQRYGIKVETIRWANKFDGSTVLRPGMELLILPVDGILHTVTRGQTLAKIAEMYGIPMQDIAAQNHVEGGFILAGQELIIPGGKPFVAAPPVIVAGKPVQSGTKPPTSGKKPATIPNVTAEETVGVFQMPCNDCTYTQYYREGHYAVDIQTKGGGPIFAAEAGTVIRADVGWNGGYGNVIEIDHGNDLVTLYGHNKELYVEEGDTVTRGQVIGWMGNTGRVYGKTGIHVHFEVRIDGVKKNPLLYLD